jgi:hypothetical protein
MKKVYLIRLTGGGDIDEKFVDEEAWNWITSNDMGQRPQDVGESCWEDRLMPASIKTLLTNEGWTTNNMKITSGSWDNDRALMCLENVSVDWSKLDLGSMRDSLKQQGFEYTGEIYEGCIY